MSNSEVIIRVDGLGKKYALRHDKNENYTSLRDVMTCQAKAAVRMLNPITLAGQLRRAQCEVVADRVGSKEEFWALKDVSFEIRRGERIEIIGRNGAGKSTLLKILSRITEPTTGRVEICGRVASLLEVGTGFHPELTGRENIYLNGAILGMTRREIRSKFDEIVEFAEVEKFLDTPVKRYSSGIYVRLAFAIAAHLEPEILIVDEVLAVGDANFQKKCLGKMQNISINEGRTLLFVSHNIAAISALCTSGVLLQSGHLAIRGKVDQAIAEYAKQSDADRNINGFSTALRRSTPGGCRIVNAWIELGRQKTNFINWDSSFQIVMDVAIEREHEISAEYLIRDKSGIPVLFSPTGLQQGVVFKPCVGQHRITANCPVMGLASGTYNIDLIVSISGVRILDYCENALSLEVVENQSRPHGWRYTQSHSQGCIPFKVDLKIEHLTEMT